MHRITVVKLLDNGPAARFPTASTLYALDALADSAHGHSVSLLAISTLNQAVSLQLIGNDENDPGSTLSAMNMGGAVALAAGGTTTQRQGFTVNLTDYRSQYYGLTVTTGATAPTTGRLDVTARLWTPQTDELLAGIWQELINLNTRLRAGR